MKNRTAILLAILVIASLGLAASCKTYPAANNSATPSSNTANIANTNRGNSTVDPPANTNTADTTVSGSLATPTEAYKTAYALRKKGDIEGLKKVMSKEVIEFMTEMGEPDNKTLDDMLKEMVKDPQYPSDDTRNEKIDGDRATVEYLKKDGTWKTMDFVKVGSDWKIAFPKPGPDEKGAKQPK